MHPPQKLPGGKGLGDLIVPACRKPPDNALLIPEYRDKQDRDDRKHTELTTYFITIPVSKIDVQDTQVGMFPLKKFPCFCTCIRLRDFIFLPQELS